MSASGAVDYLSRVLKFCVNKPKGIKGIKAPAGLGKTASLIRAIVKSSLLYVEFYVPNHRLAEECRLRFIEAGLNPDQVQTIKGRTFKAEGQSPLCKRHTVVDKLGEHNIGTYNSLCRNQESTCEYFDSCSFLAQFKLRTRVRIFVHKHLALERGLLDHRLPDLAVIDESFWQELITIKTISRESITRFIQPEALQKAILTAFDSKIPLLKHLRKRLKSNLSTIIESAIKEITLTYPDIQPSMNAEAIKSNLSLDYKHGVIIQDMLKQLLVEIQQFPKRSTLLRSVKMIKVSCLLVGDP